MRVLMTNIEGVSGLQIFPESEAEWDYLLNLDRDNLRLFLDQNFPGTMEISARPSVVRAKRPSSK